MTASQKKLLIIEDDSGLQSQMKWSFPDYELITATRRSDALAELRRHEPPVILLNLGLPPDPNGVSEGMAALSDILSMAPQTKVIVITGNDDQETPVRAIGLGAYDYYQKPTEPDKLSHVVERAFRLYELEEENRRLLRQENKSPLDGVIATSDKMLNVCRAIEKVAPTSAAVFLLGETGTGKETLARSLHNLSSRRNQPFVVINCSAIPEDAFESELFGDERAGLKVPREGKLEGADGGTVFFDKVGDLTVSQQAVLLRFLEDRGIKRLGGKDEVGIDVRVLCAARQNVSALIEQNLFRQDLYDHISEVVVSVPPLRERKGDSVALARILLDKYNRYSGRRLRGFREDALKAIEGYLWPGNVRELENRVKGAVIMAEGNRITADDLGLDTSKHGLRFLNLREVREKTEKEALQQALTLSEGNISKASQLLGISRPTVYNLMRKHRISEQD
ncbi:MAG: PEP-CTERM-box response regulator transcription factor [Gammaproteobacteria bacterium]